MTISIHMEEGPPDVQIGPPIPEAPEFKLLQGNQLLFLTPDGARSLALVLLGMTDPITRKWWP
jgi:hypothetical protein